jgi:signal peptidase I
MSKSPFRPRALVELAVIVVVAIGLAFGIQAWIVKPYKIPSISMEPTLDVGQRVLVNRLGNDFSSPHVGEIVVFHPPDGAEQEVCGAVQGQGAACDKPAPEKSTENFIKRIVAGPGDVIYIRDGHVIRNGKAEKDGYINPCPVADQCSFLTPIKIPPGMWFMMGDNRGQSDDSRYWGPVPTGWIIGQAFATYWPPSRIGFL